jgi:hypothetical protein
MGVPDGFLRDAFDAPLRPLGFSRAGRRQVWLRDCAGLAHAVSLESYSKFWTVRWDIVNPAVGKLLHGRLADVADVRWTGFITGTAQVAFGEGLQARFGLDEVADQAAIAGVAAAVTQVATWTGEFNNVRRTIEFLTQNPGEKLRVVGMTVPSNWPLRAFTAAALAVVDAQPDATELVEQAVAAMASLGETGHTRAARLVAALA